MPLTAARRRAAGRWQAIAAWVLIAIAVAAGLAGVPGPTAWAHLFFAVIFLTGGVAAAGIAGPSVQLGAALVALLLVVAQRTLDRPVYEPPSSQWTRALQGPDQEIRHTIALPLEDASWDRLWQRARAAAIYVCARSPLAADDGLELTVNDESLGTITEAQAVGPRPAPTYAGLYRIPIDRLVLERQRPAIIALRRRPGASPRPVDICGTFTYRPTAGQDSSRFFDGTRWWSPGLTQQGRFIVELRVEGDKMRVLRALY